MNHASRGYQQSQQAKTPATCFASFANWHLMLLGIMLTLVITSSAFAKGGDPIWPNPFSISDLRSGEQYAKAMAVDKEGNIIVVGSTNSGSNDYHLVKFNADGSGVAWPAISYGGSGSDVATAVAVDSANNIIVTGYVWNVTSARYDIRTIKYDKDGNKLWEHDFDAAGGNDWANAIAVDAAGNIYVAGLAVNGAQNEDFLVIKYLPGGPTGNQPAWVELSDDSLYANSYSRFTAIAVGSDGLAVTGYAAKDGADVDIVTRKYGFDKSLVREWRHSSPGGRDDRGVAVSLDLSGNVIITGYQTNSANNKDIYTAKFSPGSEIPAWEWIYDGNGNDEPTGLWVDGAGDVYVTGTTATLAGGTDIYTVRYSSAGARLWESAFDIGTGAAEIPTGIVVDDALGAADAGGVFVTGYTTASSNEDYLTIKYRKDNGAVLWQKILNGSGNKNDRPVGIALIPPTGLTPRNAVVAGWTYSNDTLNDFTAIKYDFGPLNAPTKLTAKVSSNTSITLSWSDNSINEEKFVIQRKLGESGTWADVREITSPAKPNSTESVNPPDDTNLQSNTYYYYRVRAYNTVNGDSHYSNEAHALTKVVSYDDPASTYRFDGGGIDGDHATAIITAPDNNPVVTGYSSLLEEGSVTTRTDDYLSIKLDRANPPNEVWRARFDSGDFGTDQAAGLALDRTGDLLVTGTAYLANGGDRSDDLYTIKVRTSTVTDPATAPAFMWDYQYGSGEGIDRATAIGMIRDGADSSVVIGYGQNTTPSQDDDLFVIKLNNNGSRPWTPQVYNSGRNDHPTAVAIDSAGNIIVAGYSFDLDDTFENPTGSYDWFTRKYNGSTGTLIWEDLFDGGHGDDQPYSLAVDAADNIYVTGYTMLANGKTAFQTIKYRSAPKSAGEEQWIWQKPFSYEGYDAEATSVQVDPIDGFVVIAGTTFVNATDSEFHLIRYNPADGSLNNGGWDINFDLPGSFDYVAAMAVDPSGYIYVAGNSRSGPLSDPSYDVTSNIMGLIYNHEGAFLGATSYDWSGKSDEATAIAVNNAGDAFIAGSSVNAANNSDFLVLKQTNGYLLVPAPFTATPQADFSIIDLNWQHNNAGATFVIERTIGPATPLSEWIQLATPGAGSTSFTDTSLKADTSYCYRITAFLGDKSSRKVVRCATTRVPPPVLDPPVVGPDPLASSISLTWSQVAHNTGYKIERRVFGGSWSDLVTKAANETSHTDDSGLSPGTNYYYQVSTISAAGNSMPSYQQGTITMPAAPTLNAPTNILSCQMSITWNPVTGVDAYTLYKRSGSDGYTPVANCENLPYYNTTCNVTGLNDKTTYYFQVKARNASGNSPWSNERSGTTNFPVPVLNVPYDITNNSITLSWSVITVATNYTLYYKEGAGGSYIPVPGCNPTTALSCTASSLTPRSTYYFRVTANNSCGSSDPSNEKSAQAVLGVPPLAAPTNITDTQMTLSWGTTPIFGATGYTLEYKPVGGNYAEVAGCNPTSNLSCTPTLPSPNQTYVFRVKAVNAVANGDSNWSTERSGKTLLPKPTLTGVTGTTTTNINISWNDVAGENNYVIERTPCNDSNNNSASCAAGSNYTGVWSVITNGTRPANDTSYPDNSGAAGTQYMYRIKATTTDGNYSLYSSENLYTSTMLAQPAMTLIAPVNSTTFDVSWGDITGETSYTLERKTGQNGTYAPVPGATGLAKNTGTYRDSGLELSTEYCYRVQASTSFGVPSVYSNNFLCKTTPLPEPTLAVPTVNSSTQIRLDWNQVTSNTGYEVERCITTDNNQPITHPLGTCTNLTPKRGQDVNYLVDTVTAGYTYRYRVRAWYNNSTEYTGWSTEQWATAKPPKPTLNTPTAISNNQINLSWGDVFGDNGYSLYWKENGTSPSCADNNWSGPITQALNAMSFSHSSLSSGTYHCYKIKANAAPGSLDSDDSNIVSQTTYPVAPGQPSLAVNSSSRITVSWTDVTGDTGYKIERSLNGGTWSQAGTVGANETTFPDSGLTAGTLYYYQVSPNSPNGYKYVSSWSTATTSPAAPDITVTPISEDQIDICWPLVFSATSYKVYRNSILILNPSVSYASSYCGSPYPSFGCPNLIPNVYCVQNTGLTEDTTYSYYVVASNGTDSQDNVAKSATTLSIGNQNLTATALNGGLMVRLNWTPVACSPVPCENPDYFELQRQVREGNWVRLAIVDGGTFTYTDNIAIDPNKKYRYRVRSLKGMLQSPFSETTVHALPYAPGANVCR